MIYSGATEELRAFAEATGIPVAETQAGKGSLAVGPSAAVGAIGATGTTAANALAREADVVIGIGTRYSDFTTASRSLFADVPGSSTSTWPPSTRPSTPACPLVADARAGLAALRGALGGWSVPAAYREETRERWPAWNAAVDEAFRPAAEGAARADGGARRRQRGGEAARRGGLRGRFDARRPAQAVACRGTRRATTSSTATPAWATRSPAGWA